MQSTLEYQFERGRVLIISRFLQFDSGRIIKSYECTNLALTVACKEIACVTSENNHDFSMIICTQFMEENTAKPEFPSRLNVIHIHLLDLSQSRFGVGL